MIQRLHNDVLTRVRETRFGNWPFPKRYIAGETVDKNGSKFRVTHFTTGKKSGAVYANGHYVGDSRHKTAMLIGCNQCFQEKLVL